MVEVQLSMDQSTKHVNGFRAVFVNEDTSVVEGFEIISQKPVNISLESYKESFSSIFGDAELALRQYDQIPPILAEISAIVSGS